MDNHTVLVSPFPIHDHHPHCHIPQNHWYNHHTHIPSCVGFPSPLWSRPKTALLGKSPSCLSPGSLQDDDDDDGNDNDDDDDDDVDDDDGDDGGEDFCKVQDGDVIGSEMRILMISGTWQRWISLYIRMQCAIFRYILSWAEWKAQKVTARPVVAHHNMKSCCRTELIMLSVKMIDNDPDCSRCFPDHDDDFWDVIIIIGEEDNDPDCSRCPRPFPEHRSRPNGRSGCEGRCASLRENKLDKCSNCFPFERTN